MIHPQRGKFKMKSVTVFASFLRYVFSSAFLYKKNNFCHWLPKMQSAKHYTLPQCMDPTGSWKSANQPKQKAFLLDYKHHTYVLLIDHVLNLLITINLLTNAGLVALYYFPLFQFLSIFYFLKKNFIMFINMSCGTHRESLNNTVGQYAPKSTPHGI